MASTYVHLPSAGSITGSTSTAGLKNAGLHTTVTLNTLTWTALPPIPLPNRNALAIQNNSGVSILIAFSPTAASWRTVLASWELQYDITDKIPLYGKSTNGVVTILVEELS